MGKQYFSFKTDMQITLNNRWNECICNRSLQSLAIGCYLDDGITKLEHAESVAQLSLHTHILYHQHDYSHIHSSQLITYVLTLNST